MLTKKPRPDLDKSLTVEWEAKLQAALKLKPAPVKPAPSYAKPGEIDWFGES